MSSLSDDELLAQRRAWDAVLAEARSQRRRLGNTWIDQLVGGLGGLATIAGGFAEYVPALTFLSSTATNVGLAALGVAVVLGAVRGNWMIYHDIVIHEADRALRAIQRELDRR